MPIHQKLEQFVLKGLKMDFDATSLSPSAMWDKKPIYPKLETVYASKADVNSELVE